MDLSRVRAFLNAVKTNNSLQERMNSATDAEDIVEIAKSAGYSLTAEELYEDDYENEQGYTALMVIGGCRHDKNWDSVDLF